MPNKELSLDEATIDAIADNVRKGGSVNLALKMLGIPSSTFYKYMKDARNYVELGIVPDRYHTQKYLDRIEYLYTAIIKADAEGEMKHIENLNRLAEQENDRQSSQFMLTHRYGWHPPSKHVVHHSGAFEEAAQLEETQQDLGKLTEDQLLRLAAGNEVVEGEVLEADN